MAETRLCAHQAHFMFFVGTRLSYISQFPLLLVESCDWVLANGMHDTCRPSPKAPTLSSAICHLDDDASLEATMLRATSRQKPWKWESHSLEGAWIPNDCREQPSPHTITDHITLWHEWKTHFSMKRNYLRMRSPSWVKFEINKERNTFLIWLNNGLSLSSWTR